MARKNRLLALLPALALALATLAGAADSGPAAFITPDQIRPGMKGYALTVFSGTEPERFEVEVIDVVKNALPQQDMILVMCSGHGIEHTRVVAGMSGSPVFIEGKLAGAVAYGWNFAQDPIAGITPIGDMWALTREHKPAPVAAARAAGIVAAAGRAQSMAPIATPLQVSGFSAAGLESLARELGPYNLVPMAGGGGGSTALNPEAIKKLAPGDAVGAAVVTGDFSITAIGTLTWREGDKIVAFGHPFLEAGPVTMPLVRAKIHTIIATQSSSFKMGSPEAVVGRLVWDQQAAIVGELNREAPTIPFRLTVNRPSTGDRRVYNFNLAWVPTLAPVIVRACLSEAVKSAAPAIDPLSVRVAGKYWVEGQQPMTYNDAYPVARGAFDNAFLEPLTFLVRNPYEKARLERVEMELTVDEDLEAAMIESVALDRDEALPGDEVELKIKVRPYRHPPVDYRMKVKVPDEPGMTQLQIVIAGGSLQEPDMAMPLTVDAMGKFLASLHPATRLVVSYQLPGPAIDVNGRRLPSLPPSVAAVMQPSNSTSAEAAGERTIRQWQDTPYVLVGAQRVTLKVKESR